MPHLISRLLVSMAKCHSNAKITRDVINGNWQENQMHVKKTPQELHNTGWEKLRQVSWCLSQRPVKGPLVEWFMFIFWILPLCLICLCLTVQVSYGPGRCGAE